jgi:transcriptional regulator with XRE-family HTH domain
VRLDPGRTSDDREDLASALLRLRRATGLSGERLARRCGMSQSKVSRIETGRLLPSVVDVEQMLSGLGVDEPARQELPALARMANTEYQDVRLLRRRRSTPAVVGADGRPWISTGPPRPVIGAQLPDHCHHDRRRPHGIALDRAVTCGRQRSSNRNAARTDSHPSRRPPAMDSLSRPRHQTGR